MTYKKTWLSCILWFLFTCITGILLADYSVLLWRTQISRNTGIYTIGFIFIVFVLTAGLYFLIRKVFAAALQQHKISEHTALMWEIFLVLCIFCTALLYRVYICIQNGADIVETQFYHMAVVREGMGTESIVHGASYIYVKLLSFVFSFLGNKAAAAVWVQAFIEILTILTAYFIIRKLLGKIPACIVMLTMSISTVYTNRMFMMTPEVMFFFLYMLGLFVIGSYVKAYANTRLNTAISFLGAVVSGIIIGILTYLDAVSITLLIILAGLITVIRRPSETSGKKTSPFLLLFVSVITCALAVLGVFALDACLSGDSLEVIFTAWLNLYHIVPLSNLPLNFFTYGNNYYIIECFVQLILAALLILAFWNRRKRQNAAPWMSLMLVLSAVTLFVSGVVPYHICYVFLWSVLAGIGLQQSFVIEDEAEEESTDAAVAVEETVNSVAAVGDNATVKSAYNLNDSEMPKTAAASYDNNAPVFKPRFIENPLPLPKKHEKRELDYQYEVAEDKMKFDVDVAEDDDFDK